MQLKVNSQTTVQDLHHFLDGQKSNAKVYGKREGNDLVLYVQPQRRGLFKLADKFKSLGEERSGVASERRALARQGINSVVDRFVNTALEERSGNLNVHSQLSGLLSGLRSHLQGPQGDDARANKVGRAKQALVLMQSATEKSTPAPAKPKLDLNTIISNLAQPPITAKGGEPTMSHTTPNAKSVATPIEMGGLTYVPAKLIASGGFGDVYLYRNEKSGREIAFKISSTPTSLKQQEDKLQAAAKEIQTHSNITQSSGDHVVKLLGACRMQDGSVGIATELAPNGSVADLASTTLGRVALNEQNIAPGQLSKKEARLVMLTLLHDMAKGLQSLHNDSDITHFDFKSPNVLVDGDGKGKIADFGTSYGGSEISLTDTESIEAAAYKAPELSYNQKGHETKVTNTVSQNKTELTQQLATFYKIEGKGFSDLVQDLTQPLKARKEETLSPQLKGTKGMDIWGFGASALELLSGDGVLKHFRTQFEFEKESELAKFHNSDEKAVRQPSETDGQKGKPLSLGTGDPEIDDFINFILRPKPEDRPSIEDILKHDIFKAEGMGSPEARSLIQALGSKDDGLIAQARNGLNWVN